MHKGNQTRVTRRRNSVSKTSMVAGGQLVTVKSTPLHSLIQHEGIELGALPFFHRETVATRGAYLPGSPSRP